MSDIKPARGDIIHARVRVVGRAAENTLVIPAHWGNWEDGVRHAYHVEPQDVVCIPPKPVAVGELVTLLSDYHDAWTYKIIHIHDGMAWCEKADNPKSGWLIEVNKLKRFKAF